MIMSTETTSPKNELESIKEKLQFLIKYWYYFVISMVICCSLGYIYYKIATPVWNVMSKVLLRHDESISGVNAIGKGNSVLSAFGLGGGGENIEDESIKLGSQGFVKKVIKTHYLNIEYTKPKFLGLIKQKLYDKSPIVMSVDESIADTLSALLFFNLTIKENGVKIVLKANKTKIGSYEINTYPAEINTPYGKMTFVKSEYYDKYEKPLKIKILYTNYDYMAQVYRENIKVDFEKKTSDIINMEMRADNVPWAKNILNELVNNYNREWIEDKNTVTGKTLSYIDERLKMSSDELLKADLDIKQFKNKYNLTDIEADVKYYFAMSGELQPAILEAETQLNMIETVADFVRDDKNQFALIPFSGAINNESVSAAIVNYNTLLTKRNDMYKSSTQSIFAKSFDNDIEMQRKTIIQSLDNVKNALKLALKNLRAQEKQMTVNLGKIPEVEQDYVRLKREQELQQTIYIFLLEMREQTGVKGVNLLPKLKYIDEPYPENDPVSPDKIKIALCVLLFGGAVLPLSSIYMLPYLRNFLRKRKND